MSRPSKFRRGSKSSSRKTTRSEPTKKPKIALARLPERSQAARDEAAHVLAAMRRDRKLSLTHAAKLQGVKAETVKKYFPKALDKVNGKYKVTKSDRYSVTLYVPDSHGNSVPVKTRSSKEREALGRYLHDLGRFLRGKRDALAEWHGKKVAGVDLVTSSRVLVSIEPTLSEFSLYRMFNGGSQ